MKEFFVFSNNGKQKHIVAGKDLADAVKKLKKDGYSNVTTKPERK